MAEQDSGTQAEGAGERQFMIQKIYLKDVSVETPNTPAIFQEQWEPDVSLQLGNNTTALGQGVHEVVLSLTVTAKLGDKTAYLVEIQQAGIFTITGYDEASTGTLLGSVCPGILFPYGREAISDLVTKAGFPQLVLAPVNFDALYQQHLQQQGQAEPAEVTH